MSRRRRWLAGAATACALLACDAPPRHADFAVGMGRSELRQRFGEPRATTRMHKIDDAVWGPIEDFWPRVPMGSSVEIWSYCSSHPWVAGGPPQAGTTELYFVDGSSRVSGLGFAPDGVVY